MFKKMGAFLGVLACSVTTCNALKMEILDGDFSFVIDTREKTATIRWIYISAHTKKEIVIPKYVKDYHGDQYLVTEIQEDAIKQVIRRITYFIARDAFMNNEKNAKALSWLEKYKVPSITLSKDYDSDSSE